MGVWHHQAPHQLLHHHHKCRLVLQTEEPKLLLQANQYSTSLSPSYHKCMAIHIGVVVMAMAMVIVIEAAEVVGVQEAVVALAMTAWTMP